jgi:hypothetical protein
MNGSSPGMDGARLCCVWPENKRITACTSKLSRTFVASGHIAIIAVHKLPQRALSGGLWLPRLLQ